MPDIAIGRKESMKTLHVASWRTIQVWKKTDAGFNKILRRAPNGKPFIVISEAIGWFIDYDKITRKKRQAAI